MEFNIAFNTIFYICIFIIPGILLRRFFYHSEFSKEFSQGNLLERLMWTILSSIISLFLCGLFFIGIRFYADLLPAISYTTVKNVFDLLGANELPEAADLKPIYTDFLYLIIGIYILSCLFGMLAHKLVLFIGTNSRLSFFKFKNYWYYFFRGKVKNATNDRKRKFWYTDADILVDQEGKAKMYSGKISDYYIEATQNQLESIFLENVRRYKFLSKDCNLSVSDLREDEVSEKEKKLKNPLSRNFELIPIPGDVFCIPYSRVLNMNLTYVTQEKGISRINKIIWGILNILYYAVIIIPFTFFWIEEIPYLNFPAPFYKLWFFLNVIFTSTILYANLETWLIEKKEVKVKDILFEIIAICCFVSQFLWILGYFRFWPVFATSVFVLLLAAAGLDEKKNNKVTSKKDKAI